MTDEEFDNLVEGDVINNNAKGYSCVVIGHDEYGIIAIRIVHSSMPEVWDVLRKSTDVKKAGS